MSAFGLIPRVRMALLALLTLALVATGWAHRVPEASGEALAFMAATGATAADFCGEVGGGKRADPLCQACQIAGGADLPPRAGVVRLLAMQAGDCALRPQDGVVLARVLDLSRTPQGPPTGRV